MDPRQISFPNGFQPPQAPGQSPLAPYDTGGSVDVPGLMFSDSATQHQSILPLLLAALGAGVPQMRPPRSFGEGLVQGLAGGAGAAGQHRLAQQQEQTQYVRGQNEKATQTANEAASRLASHRWEMSKMQAQQAAEAAARQSEGSQNLQNALTLEGVKSKSATELERLRNQGDLNVARVRSSAKQPGDFNPADYVETSEMGHPFINTSGIAQIPQRQAAQDYAKKNGIAAINDKGKNALDLVNESRGNVDTIRGVIRSFAPHDAFSRIWQGPMNKAAEISQSNPSIASYKAFRTAAIQTIQAIAGLGTGLRINQAEINAAMQNDIPTITDTQDVAAGKLDRLGSMLDHVEEALVGKATKPRVAPTPTDDEIKAEWAARHGR